MDRPLYIDGDKDDRVHPFYVYETCRLWALSREILEGIRRLDLRAVLENEGNASEFRRRLHSIDGSRFRGLIAGCS